MTTFKRLEQKRLDNEDTFPDDLRLRARRFTSWLGRAEREMASGDYDAAFIFYWIAFNAAYADGRSETRLESRESDVFSDYFGKIIQLDSQRKVYNAALEQFWEPMVELLKNKYVFGPFWDFHNGLSGNADWEFLFRRDLVKVDAALDRWDTKEILRILFYRLYVLRNQVIHGGATWEGSVNRAQVTDGAMIMASLVPLFIELMMDNPDTPWPPPPYPLVRDSCCSIHG